MTALHHRLAARRLNANPMLVAHARDTLEQWRHTRPYALWMDEWASLLRLPVSELRRELTRRTEEANRLRISSPFAVSDDVSIKDLSLRRRLWRVARRGMPERSTILGALSGR